MKIRNAKEVLDGPIKIVVAGESGNGKTYLAKSITEKVLIVSAEGGLRAVAGSNIDYMDITVDDDNKLVPKEKRFSKIPEIYAYLCKPETQANYGWVFIDSLTEIGQNLYEELSLKFPDRKDALVLWSEYASRMRGMIKSFRDLPHYNVVFTVLCVTDKDQDGKRMKVIDLNGSISEKLPQFFDEVFYLNVQDRVRTLITDKTAALGFTKDRSGTLELQEPADLMKIAGKIRGGKS